MRSRMQQDRLSALPLLNIESDITTDIDIALSFHSALIHQGLDANILTFSSSLHLCRCRHSGTILAESAVRMI